MLLWLANSTTLESSYEASLQPNFLPRLPRWFLEAFLYVCDLLVDNCTAVMASPVVKYLLVLVAAVPHSLSAVLQPTPPMGKTFAPCFEAILTFGRLQ
jgi:hypothetical protein